MGRMLAADVVSCWAADDVSPTRKNESWLAAWKNGTRKKKMSLFLFEKKIGGIFSTVMLVFFGGVYGTSYGNEAMLTAKWQITLLTTVVTHQIHSKSALFKSNAFEPIWWIQSCSNRSTAGKILWKNGVVPPDGYVMIMFRPDILNLLNQHLLYKVKCCQIAKHIFDVLMFQHLSIQIWLTSACIWHILTICISLKH